jgi:hypothetical protein
MTSYAVVANLTASAFWLNRSDAVTPVSASSGTNVVETKTVFKVSPVFSSFRLVQLGFGLALWLCLPLIGTGQSSEDFTRLIFEPAVMLQNSPGSDESGQESIPAASGPASSSVEAPDGQPGGDANLLAEISRYESALDDSLQGQDQYSPQLREQYEALGELLQQNNEHERAIAMFENAMQIDRVNNGLFTNLQIPLIRQIIESQSALGNREELDDMHGYLYYIHQKAFAADSEEFLAAKEEWADWNVTSYLQEGGNGLTGNYALFGAMNSASSAYEYVPIQNTLTGSYIYIRREHLPNALNAGLGTGRMTDLYMQSAPYAVSPEQMVDERLRTAEDLYEEILEARANQNKSSSTADVQHKLANIAFAVKRQMDVLESQMIESSFGFNRTIDQTQPNIVVSRGYNRNLKALETIAQELENSAEADPLEKARAYINLGDWNISYDRTQRSEQAYAKAWQILRDANFPDEAIRSVMLPQPLVLVPAYAVHEFSREFYNLSAEAPLEYKGYIDATVDLDRFGRVGNIRIEESPETPRRVRDTLFTYLRENKMRPAIENGELVKLSDVKTRYYYSY